MSTVTRRPRKRIWRRDGGQSLAEFAIVAPIFFLLVFGIIDFGMGLRAYIGVSTATREGARFAAVGAPAGSMADCTGTVTTTAVGRVCAHLSGLKMGNVQNVSVNYPTGSMRGNPVRVSAQYRYNFITPIDGLVKLLSGGSLGAGLTLSSATEMRLE